MTGRVRVLGIIVLLLLASPDAYSQTELYYDDGSAEIGMAWQTPNNGAAVRFTVTPPVQLESARFYVMTAQPGTDLGEGWLPSLHRSHSEISMSSQLGGSRWAQAESSARYRWSELSL